MNKENLIIRAAKKEDVSAIFSLIHQLAIFEKEPDSVLINEAELARDGFGSNPLYTAYVAEFEGVVCAFTLHYYRYSTWKGKSIYLEDFIVDEAFRSKGIGKALFDNLLKICEEENVRQMNWQVLDWNESAIKFYDRYKANYDGEWLNAYLLFNKKAST